METNFGLSRYTSASVRLGAAIEIAHAHRVLLIGYYVVETAHVASYAMVGEALSIAELEDEERTRLSERAESMRRVFFQRTEAAHVAAEWHCVDAQSARHQHHQASFADLLIVGQDERPEIDLGAAGVVLGSGRPVLVLPEIGDFGAIGRRALVAWNASRESIRALNDSLPFLKRADEVHLVVVGPDEVVNEIPLAEVCFHLERHGVKAQPKTLRALPKEPGDALLSYATDEGMDLVVMGAYSRSRLSEFLLGGVTRRILNDTVVPVFVSH